MKNECLLWEKAKDLGQERGLTLSGTCPINSFCSGERCIYQAPAINFPDKIKLEKLRKELVTLKK